MDLVDKLLAAVPKDKNGFEDIDKFWAATDKLTFPFTQRFKTKLFQLNSSTKKVSAQRRSNLSGFSSLNASAINDSTLFDNDSDTDFDYNTSSSVSVVSAIIDDEEDDLSEIEPDESFIRDKSTRSSASKSSLLATPLSSDSQSLSSIDDDNNEDTHLSLDNEEEMSKSRTSRRSSVSRSGKNTSSISAASSVNATPVSVASNKKKNASSSGKKGKDTTLDQSAFNDVTVDEDNFNDLSLLNKSTTTARGRKSSLLSRDSQLLGDGDENDEEPTASAKKTPSKSAEKTHEDTVTASGGRSTRSGRSSSLTPSAKTQQPSILLSSIKKSKDTNNNNTSRRVSFGHEALHFNDDDDNFSETSVLNKSETVSVSATKKRRQSGDKSNATNDMSETTIYHEGDTFELSKSSVATHNDEDDETHKTQVSEQSDLRNETDDNFNDNFNDNDNYDYADETQPEVSQDVSHDVSQQKTRSTGGKRRKSAVSQLYDNEVEVEEENEVENEVVRTPQRRGGATKGRSTPYDLSTPKSQEFQRGTRRLDDTTFVLNSSDDDNDSDKYDDKEDDNSSDDTDTDKRTKRAKKHTHNARHSEEGVTSPETQNVSLSFVDNSFLATISSANKKYAGKKVQATHQEKAKERKRFLRKQKQLKAQLKAKNNGKLSRELAALINLLSDESDLDKEIAKHKNLKRSRPQDNTAGTQDDTEEDLLFDRDTDDDTEEEEEENEEVRQGGAARRSRRATKGMRFAFWKNERPIYEEGVLIDVKPPDPTPRKPRRTRTTQNKKPSKNNARNVKRKLQDAFSSSDNDNDEEDETAARTKKLKRSSSLKQEREEEQEEEAVSLPENVSFLEPTTHEVLQVWDDYYDRPVSQQVVYVTEAQPAPQPLPVTGERPRHRVQDVGYAAHFFHHLPETASNAGSGFSGFSGWMAGAIDLPPHAIKDAEGVGKYLQVFFVAQGQRQALEFGLANPETDAWVDETAQRLLLSPGDSFYVPPGNIYRLENHSATTEAKLFWMIVYPVEENLLQLQQQTMSEQTVVSGVSH